MNLPPRVPPLKCQGIKTKLVGEIDRIAQTQVFNRWVEPFCGSGVVALNLQPKAALLADSNVHIIRLYQEIQSGARTPGIAKAFLVAEGENLRAGGEPYYYTVRERFNAAPTSLDFLFLNRSCFNGVMRFNRHGKFNVPYGHKPERFAQAYVTKITNQIRRISEVIVACDWTLTPADFRQTLASTRPGDLVYADPPYAGRHVTRAALSTCGRAKSKFLSVISSSTGRACLTTAFSRLGRRRAGSAGSQPPPADPPKPPPHANTPAPGQNRQKTCNHPRSVEYMRKGVAH